MPINWVSKYLGKGKGKSKKPPKETLDAALKEELDEAVKHLREFSKNVKQELEFIDYADKKHLIPDRLIKSQEEE